MLYFETRGFCGDFAVDLVISVRTLIFLPGQSGIYRGGFYITLLIGCHDLCTVQNGHFTEDLSNTLWLNK